MLRIEITLVPYGIEERKKVLHRMEIWNDGCGDKYFADYGFHVFQKGRFNRLWREGRVETFPRKKGAWELLRECLNAFL